MVSPEKTFGKVSPEELELKSRRSPTKQTLRKGATPTKMVEFF
jgi:hypothetical protein